MTTSIQELARLAKVSPRTLRYYDQIGLLPAKRNPQNGYREYDARAVDRLQMIRYFQLFGFSLTAIQELLDQSSARQTAALAQQRQRLLDERDHLTTLLTTLDRTLAARNGGPQMTDSEKFSAFKQQQLTTNDREFGQEARERYGTASVAASQRRFAALSEIDYQAMQTCEQRLLTNLKTVAQSGDMTSDLARQVFDDHKTWLCFTWNNYSPATHRGLAELYLSDDRFTSYYNDRVGLSNATATLVTLIQHYAQ
ncbi:MerR family transcriptional regulator [Levilactobacillus huananensis]|uniref:MerR family transcriptional regulator n=1 Tax=Levilactobacillus huananensis TaxID=2486019 RepID=UPI000F77A8C5|nr:MerR family transcriptional regulator [Levilactobacillus huananensis]